MDYKNFTLIRQGDLTIMSVDSLPELLKVKKTKTLAYGEFTGHSHRFDDQSSVVVLENDTDMYIEVKDTSTLVHEEHGPHTLTKGFYKVLRKTEYDPFSKMKRIVTD